jgi:amino acid transporter
MPGADKHARMTPSEATVAPGADGIAAFGYKQELRRSLGLWDLLAYGLVFITPIAPVSVFGIVFNASHGMVPLVYVIGLVAMIFVALSYMAMADAFPVAGSVYTYAARSLGPVAGFFAGWAILLDYLLIPTLCYVASAIAITSVFPALSKPLCVIVMILLATVVNYLGIESTVRTSFALLAFQLAVLVLFGILGINALLHHAGGAHVSFAPFFNPAVLTPALVFGALSLAVLSFLGFDAISTLSEESRHGSQMIGRATLVALCLSALLFVAQTWIACLFLPGRTSLAPGDPTNAAFFDIAALVGGPAFKFVLAIPGTFLSLLAGAITAQAATARLLFSMARDGKLPRALAHVDQKRNVPNRSVFVVAAVTLVTGTLLVDRFELLTSMVSFGALLGFLFLQVSVAAYFIGKKKSRDWFRHLIAPAIGFAIIAYVLANAEPNAKIAGGAWIVAGAVVFVALNVIRRPASLPL